MVGTTIKEMEKTTLSPEEFLTAPVCQPSFYSSAVKSPMIHAAADDITKREEFLNNIWLYYSKKESSLKSLIRPLMQKILKVRHY